MTRMEAGEETYERAREPWHYYVPPATLAASWLLLASGEIAAAIEPLLVASRFIGAYSGDGQGAGAQRRRPGGGLGAALATRSPNCAQEWRASETS